MLGVCVGDSFWVVNPEGIALSVAMWIGRGGGGMFLSGEL